jgi:hypothetical protein
VNWDLRVGTANEGKTPGAGTLQKKRSADALVRETSAGAPFDSMTFPRHRTVSRGGQVSDAVYPTGSSRG